jgi:hypothetical protein
MLSDDVGEAVDLLRSCVSYLLICVVPQAERRAGVMRTAQRGNWAAATEARDRKVKVFMMVDCSELLKREKQSRLSE